MLSAIYSFHFRLIIGRLAAKIHIYIFLVMPKKETQNVVLKIPTTFSCKKCMILTLLIISRVLLVTALCEGNKKSSADVSQIMAEMSNITLELKVPRPCVTFRLTNHTLTL